MYECPGKGEQVPAATAANQVGQSMTAKLTSATGRNDLQECLIGSAPSCTSKRELLDGILCPDSQREKWRHGRSESQGRDSGADFSRAQGKGVFTPAAPRNNQRIPCRSSLPD